MVKSLTPPALVLAALIPVTACGDIKGALDFVDTRDDFRERTEMLQGRSNTAYLAVPDSGSTTFNGEASLGVGSDADGMVLLGDATVTVDFGDNDVTGELTNFTGFDTNKDYAEYNGTLTLEDGLLGSTNPNDVEAQIVGTLTGDGNTIGVDAFWEGHLKGTPIIGVLGDTTPGESTFTLNGDTVVGGMVIATSN